MKQYSLLVISFVILSFSLPRSSTMTSIITCQSNSLTDAANPKIRQLCYVLEQIIDEVPQELIDYEPQRLARSQENKRTDVDHVFLRFGRRLGR